MGKATGEAFGEEMTLRIDAAIVLSALSLVVSTADFFASRARSRRLEEG